jgi:hypothetical protein
MASLAVDPDLVIYYSFDNFSSIVPDDSGKGHNGTVFGDITPDAGGMRGGAAKFVMGAYIDLDGANFPMSDIPTDAMTLCAWGKPGNTGDNQAIFNARAEDQTWVVHPEFRGSGVFRWLLRTAGGTTIFDIQDGKWNPDQWIHFAGVYSSADNKARLFANGELVKELDTAGNIKIVGDWKMGARVGKNIDDARPFAGLMDDFCMFKRALSQDEVKSVMNGGPEIAASVSSEGSITTTWGKIKN